MKHVRITTLAAAFILLSFYFLISPIQVVHADSTIATLSIYAFDKDGDLTSGHAWITIRNNTASTLDFLSYPIDPGKTISVSIWPDSKHNLGYGGVFINREMNYPTAYSCTWLSTEINLSQLNRIASMTPAESYYHDARESAQGEGTVFDDILHNCTTYSKKMWNAVAPFSLRVNELGIDAPLWLENDMKTKSGYHTGAFSPERCDPYHVFYVSQSRDLVPYAMPAPVLSVIPDAETGIMHLSWTSSKIDLLKSGPPLQVVV